MLSFKKFARSNFQPGMILQLQCDEVVKAIESESELDRRMKEAFQILQVSSYWRFM